uniref:Uncharacterized protein n=1 Tax=Ditylenchus dipsaci TaxID=166011 RepID=A0A915E5N2_9BILA
MLTIIWLLLTLLLAVGQLLVVAQTDWLVHGPLHQGVYALCYHNHCQWRQFQHSNLAMGILLGFFLANFMLWVTLVLTMASMFRTACDKDREGCLRVGKVVDLAANAQFFSGLLTGVSLALMPFDMQEIFCTTNELLKSIANCSVVCAIDKLNCYVWCLDYDSESTLPRQQFDFSPGQWIPFEAKRNVDETFEYLSVNEIAPKFPTQATFGVVTVSSADLICRFID